MIFRKQLSVEAEQSPDGILFQAQYCEYISLRG